MNASQATKATVILASQSLTTGGLTTTANLDTLGAEYATILVNLSAYTTPSGTSAITVELLESDNTVASNFATYTGANSVTSGAAAASGAVSRDYRFDIDMRYPRKRYQQVSVTNGTTGTGNAMVVGAVGILSKLQHEPASTSDMVGSTNDVVTGPL
jgi:hypothetical protein